MKEGGIVKYETRTIAMMPIAVTSLYSLYGWPAGTAVLVLDDASSAVERQPMMSPSEDDLRREVFVADEMERGTEDLEPSADDCGEVPPA